MRLLKQASFDLHLKSFSLGSAEKLSNIGFFEIC